MTNTERKGKGARALSMCRAALEAHYVEHRTIPSMAGLARLWNYASKSSAAHRVDQLIAAKVLLWSPDRRLAPGPAFRGTLNGERYHPTSDDLAEPGEENGADPLNAALAAWASDYDPLLVRSYTITTRILRLARAMELGMGRSAASEGLTSGDVLLLDALYRAGPPHRIAPTLLKHYFLMSLAGVAKRVDRLESLGLIKRVPNTEDRRGLFIQMTAAGRATLARLVAGDRAAPHIVWPTALTEAQYGTMLKSLTIAEDLIAAANLKKNDSSTDRSDYGAT